MKQTESGSQDNIKEIRNNEYYVKYLLSEKVQNSPPLTTSEVDTGAGKPNIKRDRPVKLSY